MKKSYNVVLNKEESVNFKNYLNSEKIYFESSCYNSKGDVYFSIAASDNEVITINIYLDFLNNLH